jgi:hypothetical protein
MIAAATIDLMTARREDIGFPHLKKNLFRGAENSAIHATP